MAVLDIGQPSWQYDDAAQVLLLRFVESCPRSEADPASWHPAWDYTLAMPLPSTMPVAVVPHVDPDAVDAVDLGPG